MAYLLDTDIVILYLADDPDAVPLVESLAPRGIAVSIVTYLETYQGTLRERDLESAQAVFDRFMAAVPIVPLSPAVARRCAEVRETLRDHGRQVRHRAFDLVIAATALHHGLFLVTNNRRDFHDVPDLLLHPGQ